eukprot:64598_1
MATVSDIKSCIDKLDADREMKYREKLKTILEEYETCFVITKENVSSSQFGQLRKELSDRARFLFGRNILIRDTIRDYVQQTNNNQWMLLLPHIRGQCGLVFTNEANIKELRNKIESNTRDCFVKYGQKSPKDIWILPGSTGLEPTQTSSFQESNIPTRIRRGQIDITDKIKLVSKGDTIKKCQSQILLKLNMKPITYKPTVQYVLQNRELFDAKVFDITAERIQNSFASAIQQTTSLCISLNYPTLLNVPYSMYNAYATIVALSLNFNTYTWDGLDEIRERIIPSVKCAHTMAVKEEESEASSSMSAAGLFGDDSSNSDASSDEYIGLSVGGSKDTNNFRQCIDANIMPSTAAITYNGLLYEYYFDTKTRKSVTKTDNDIKQDIEDEKDDGSMLFYPTYCYAKVQKIDFINDEIRDDIFEYYMTVGMNSNIKKNEFKRKYLNLIILLDVSGSMGFCFASENSNKTKMSVANESCVALLKHLSPKDRFSLVTFESNTKTVQNMQFVNDINMNELATTITTITDGGGTDFECGYTKVLQIFNTLFSDNEYSLNTNVMDRAYENRVIIVTDAQPSNSESNSSLLGMVRKCAENEKVSNRIYTTFIGVGLDFNARLVERISETRGCNYYCVKSAQEFKQTMADEFEYMVTPLIFNVCLKLNCEGNSCEIEKVYGCNADKAAQIVNNGEIKKIHTLFPSKKSTKKGGTKGGIQLFKLRKNGTDQNDSINVEIEVTFEDRNGKLYRNAQFVTFKPPKLQKVNNDMIENESYEEEKDRESLNFYDNIGIRKGILLCKYVELMLSWINNEKAKDLSV